MPSASAVLDNRSQNEILEPIKNALTSIEKKVRNLEKRKQKLDQYKSDQENGKELIEDQKNAVKKYDQVLEFLEFARDFQKQFNTLLQDSTKAQKRVAKRELAERQQLELQRLREILLIQDVLTNMGTDTSREDFLKGTGKACKLTEKELNHLDDLYKLVLADRNKEGGALFSDQLAQASEHLVALVEGKNKEAVTGTTYKELKALCLKIHNCGYFDPHVEVACEVVTNNGAGDQPSLIEDHVPEIHQQEKIVETSAIENSTFTGASPPAAYVSQPRPATEITPTQPSLNFLQESQIDLESPHMDPAVVVAHPMAPQATFHHSQYQKSQHTLSSGMNSQSNIEVSGGSHQQTLSNHSAVVSQPMLLNSTQDFNEDGSKIPTQTFTNQNFSIQSMMQTSAIPTSYGPISSINDQSLSSGRSLNHDVMSQNLVKQYEPSNEISNTISSQYQNFTSDSQGTFQSSQSAGTNQETSGGYSNNRNDRGHMKNRGPSNGYSRGGRGGYGSGSRGNNYGGYQSNFNSNSNFGSWKGAGNTGRGPLRSGGTPGGRGGGSRGNGARGTFQNQ